MLKTKLSIAIVLVAILSLLLVPAAYAAPTTGSFTASAVKPVVDSIAVFSDSGLSIPVNMSAGMTPTTEYYAKLTVTCNNKLSYLDTVTATIYYDSAGTHGPPSGGGDTQTLAVFTWHSSGTTWTKDSGTPSTWTIETADCVAPALTGKQGDWIFAFKPGKVAHQSITGTDWDAEGKATSKKPETSDPKYYTAMAMNFFSEVSITGSVAWNPATLGMKYLDAPNSQVVTKVNYLANGNYDENIKSSATWTGTTMDVTLDESDPAGNPPAADGQFALKADDTATLASAVIVKNSTATAIDNTGTITGESGDDVATNNLWLSLSAAGIAPETYTGQIFYEIANR
jgi:hypothetical protein